MDLFKYQKQVEDEAEYFKKLIAKNKADYDAFSVKLKAAVKMNDKLYAAKKDLFKHTKWTVKEFLLGDQTNPECRGIELPCGQKIYTTMYSRDVHRYLLSTLSSIFTNQVNLKDAIDYKLHNK